MRKFLQFILTIFFFDSAITSVSFFSQFIVIKLENNVCQKKLKNDIIIDEKNDEMLKQF